MPPPYAHGPRRGVAKCFTIDPDAIVLLKALCPNSRGVGLMLSELIRREARERTERPRLLAALAAQTDEP
jgi:hypothetical protein